MIGSAANSSDNSITQSERRHRTFHRLIMPQTVTGTHRNNCREVPASLAIDDSNCSVSDGLLLCLSRPNIYSELVEKDVVPSSLFHHEPLSEFSRKTLSIIVHRGCDSLLPKTTACLGRDVVEYVSQFVVRWPVGSR